MPRRTIIKLLSFGRSAAAFIVNSIAISKLGQIGKKIFPSSLAPHVLMQIPGYFAPAPLATAMVLCYNAGTKNLIRGRDKHV